MPLLCDYQTSAPPEVHFPVRLQDAQLESMYTCNAVSRCWHLNCQMSIGLPFKYPPLRCRRRRYESNGFAMSLQASLVASMTPGLSNAN